MRWIYSGKRLMLLTCKSKFFVFVVKDDNLNKSIACVRGFS